MREAPNDRARQDPPDTNETYCHPENLCQLPRWGFLTGAHRRGNQSTRGSRLWRELEPVAVLVSRTPSGSWPLCLRDSKRLGAEPRWAGVYDVQVPPVERAKEGASSFYGIGQEVRLAPVPGTLILFPPHFEHYVYPHFPSEPRT